MIAACVVMAAQGMLCVLVRMPWNLAVLDIDAAERIQEMSKEVNVLRIIGAKGIFPGKIIENL